MYIYLDDSGNIDSVDGPLYIWAGFSIESNPNGLKTKLDGIFQSYKPKGKDKELKGNTASFAQRKKVFECLAGWDGLRISYVVADKKEVTLGQSTFMSGKASRAKEQSENYFMSKVISRLATPYPNQKNNNVFVYIDGSPSSAPLRKGTSEIRLHEYLSLRINFPKWNTKYYWNDFNVIYVPQINHGLMQAVDFIASFINEYYKYMYYKKKRPRTSSEMVALYNILLPKIHHKIYKLPNISLL